MALVNLLGDKVLNGEDTMVDVSSLEGDGKVLGLYFSAHWCPPCRAFTPQLAQWYKDLRASPIGDKFNLVFVSSDRDEKSFKEYFADMPWLALPYDLRDTKTTLSKKFKVAGIPTLVLVDAATGSTITGDGRSIVMEDPTGKDFPWAQKGLDEVLYSGIFKGKGGKDIEADCLKGKTLGLYFSAHWCGPCRAFTPTLSDIYAKVKVAHPDFEIVFVSSDKDEKSYTEYFETMPWISLPYGDSRKKTLSRMFDVQGIPCLVMVDKDGQTITTKARSAIAGDPEGKAFPWSPAPVRALTSYTASDLNDCAALVWFNNESPINETLDLMKPLAAKKIGEWKSAGATQKLLFYVSDGAPDADDDNIADSLKKFAGLDKSNPSLAIIDIEAQKVFASEETDVTMETVTKFVEDYLNEALVGSPFKSQ